VLLIDILFQRLSTILHILPLDIVAAHSEFMNIARLKDKRRFGQRQKQKLKVGMIKNWKTLSNSGRYKRNNSMINSAIGII
jgi:hypothetical protein